MKTSAISCKPINSLGHKHTYLHSHTHVHIDREGITLQLLGSIFNPIKIVLKAKEEDEKYWKKYRKSAENKQKRNANK